MLNSLHSRQTIPMVVAANSLYQYPMILPIPVKCLDDDFPILLRYRCNYPFSVNLLQLKGHLFLIDLGNRATKGCLLSEFSYF